MIVKLGLLVYCQVKNTNQSASWKSQNHLDQESFISGVVLERTGPKSRSWKVKWTLDNSISIVASSALGDKPPANNPLQALPPVQHPQAAAAAAAIVNVPINNFELPADPDQEDNEMEMPVVPDDPEPEEELDAGLVAADHTVDCHGVQWKLLPRGPELVDSECNLEVPALYNHKTSFDWDRIGLEYIGGSYVQYDHDPALVEPLFCFFLMYPVESLMNTVRFSNELLTQKNSRYTLSNHLLFKLYGILILMSLRPRQNHRDFFESFPDDPSLHPFPPMNFSQRFNFPLLMYEELWACLRFGKNVDNSDPWCLARPCVDDFNKRMVKITLPGKIFSSLHLIYNLLINFFRS